MLPAALFDPTVAFVLLVLGVLAVTWELHAPGMFVPGIVGTLLIIGAIYGLFVVSPEMAIASAAATLVILAFLAWLAMRASRAKKLTGIQTLIGETGVARTALNPDGTVFVNGEYWQARSDHPIESGQTVRVEKVDNMTIWVTEAKA